MKIKCSIFFMFLLVGFSLNYGMNNFLSMSIRTESGGVSNYALGLLGLCCVGPSIIKFIKLKKQINNKKNELNVKVDLFNQVNSDLIAAKKFFKVDSEFLGKEYNRLKDKLGIFPNNFFSYEQDILSVEKNNRIVKKIFNCDKYKNKTLTIWDLKVFFTEDIDFLAEDKKNFIINYIYIFFAALYREAKRVEFEKIWKEEYQSQLIENYTFKEYKKFKFIVIFLNFFSSERFLVSYILGKDLKSIELDIKSASEARKDNLLLNMPVVLNQKLKIINDKILNINSEKQTVEKSINIEWNQNDDDQIRKLEEDIKYWKKQCTILQTTQEAIKLLLCSVDKDLYEKQISLDMNSQLISYQKQILLDNESELAPYKKSVLKVICIGLLASFYCVFIIKEKKKLNILYVLIPGVVLSYLNYKCV